MRIANLTRLGGSCLALAMLCGNDRQSAGVLPDRLLTCSIGHVINFDPHKDQTAADLRFDGFHDFSLFLPAIAVPKGAPRDASEPALPVDSRTRIVSDPDRISGSPKGRKSRRGW